MTLYDPNTSTELNSSIPGLNLGFESWMDLLESSCCSDQDLVLFLKVLPQHPEWMNLVDQNKQTLTMRASEQGYVDILNALIKAGADLNVQDQWGWTALMRAVMRGSNPKVVKTLIEAGADLNLHNQQGLTALMWASNLDRTSFVKVLIEAGADLHHQDQFGRTALIYASLQGHIDVVKALIQEGSDLNHQDQGGWTPLMHASDKGHFDVVQELTHHGADPFIRNQHLKMALDLARNEGRRTVLLYLEAYVASCLSEQTLSQVLTPLDSSSSSILSHETNDVHSSPPRIQRL